ncbi:hypothetical protein C5B42_00315 [Candidatus Cerribacteria bacterium 'Amazon FNV 2010 28 9']|uniref:SAM-dependent methyltransferase n=1 Tax=Candidatus Cerribacteria bacterium 'Amazon FNV 2010 28 9' TaxID=2081795 RepID=A0A317JRN1_9BACT|nr:MAG: hypothetical protein C5B42_00315 [Candidatus Cerribacteria bacterium 'Amazon FNV 2010 28 9']
MKKKTTCRCCGKKKLVPYLDLGVQPLANSYHKGGKQNYYPLVVMVCTHCFNSQLSVVVDPDEMYKNYLYVSGTTKTFQAHCAELARDAVKRVGKRPRVLDIACNDGTQLECFRALGADVIGVDPAENLRHLTVEKNIPVEVAYWDQTLAAKIGKFDIITATNVFAHADDSDEFLKAAKLSLKEDGVLIIEFPYGLHTVEQNEFDQVYHEHLSYFLVNSFAVLARRLHFTIVDIIQTSIHGGSIRFVLQKGQRTESPKVVLSIENEKKKGLLQLSTYRAYAKRIDTNKKKLRILVNKLHGQGKKVVGYGASAKGNTMLNFFGLNIAYIVDDNSLKWGYATPGRNIPIVSPAMLEAEKDPLFILILSWNFSAEIATRVWEKRKQSKDKAVLYVPTIRSVAIQNLRKK